MHATAAAAAFKPHDPSSHSHSRAEVDIVGPQRHRFPHVAAVRDQLRERGLLGRRQPRRRQRRLHAQRVHDSLAVGGARKHLRGGAGGGVSGHRSRQPLQLQLQPDRNPNPTAADKESAPTSVRLPTRTRHVPGAMSCPCTRMYISLIAVLPVFSPTSRKMVFEEKRSLGPTAYLNDAVGAARASR